MDVAYISALAALAGSVVGGLTTGLTSGLSTWLNQRGQARAARYAYDLSRRQDLYRDFIVAASKAYGEAVVSSEPRVEELIGLYAMISRMRTMSQPRTITCADTVMRVTIETYFAPNKTLRELNELIKMNTAMDPLKDFSEAAREELQALRVL
jgi:hypothetical protein